VSQIFDKKVTAVSQRRIACLLHSRVACQRIGRRDTARRQCVSASLQFRSAFFENNKLHVKLITCLLVQELWGNQPQFLSKHSSLSSCLRSLPNYLIMTRKDPLSFLSKASHSFLCLFVLVAVLIMSPGPIGGME
jgi:hypothetical protein